MAVEVVKEITGELLARGPKGDTGPSNSLSIGTVESGDTASATITGESPKQVLNLVLPTTVPKHVKNITEVDIEKWNTKNEVVGNGEKESKGYVTFITDDGRLEDYTLFKDIFAKYGIGCTTAVTTDVVGQYTNGSQKCTVEQLKELQDKYGWEICSHVYHSDLTSLTDKALDSELRESRKWLIDNGFNGYDYLMYPYGKYDERVKRFASKYYKMARTTGEGLATYPINSLEVKGYYFNNSESVSAKTGFARNTLDHWKALIDIANNEKLWLIIWTHSWEVAEWGNTDLFEQVVAYASENANCVSCKEAVESIGNIVDQTSYDSEYDDHFVIGKNGKVSSNIGKIKVLEKNSVAYATPPLGFDKDFISVCNITGEDKANFPYGKSGVLETYCFSPTHQATDVYYYYQIFYPYSKGELFYRTALNTNSWGKFKAIGARNATTEARTADNYYKEKYAPVFDTTLNKVVYWTGATWVDALGNVVE